MIAENKKVGEQMERFNLGGQWMMAGEDGREIQGTVPGSVYSFLLDAGLMEDPYYRDNELRALELMEKDYSFTRHFDAPEKLLRCAHQIIRFEGVDTLADIYLNDIFIGHTDNMHITWEFDVREALREKDNLLLVKTYSPLRYIREEDAKHHLGGSTDAMLGFPHLRKAHCMFGWDWGPRLPDQGIWRDVQLLGWNEVRIEDVRIRQEHLLPDGRHVEDAPDGGVAARSGELQVRLTAEVDVAGACSGKEGSGPEGGAAVRIELTAPDGTVYEMKNGEPFTVPEPQLWWPNGLGGQPLYTLKVTAAGSGEEDSKVLRIGLRSATILKKPDQWGETFAVMVNGRTVFSMGADYIPEDNILSRMNRERTKKLLTDCLDAHFNTIRVWGGGFYPGDDFFELCDEMGLLVWQDFMFACANYRITEPFVNSITEEIRQNVRRLRHHPSLLLWCGNNEMEQFALERVYDGSDETAADYLIQNEYIIPSILRDEDPDRFYWPSSPSSGGKFSDPRDPNRGDVHYWAVWHEDVPFTAYREYFFRYLSEFGFQSLPCMETVCSFTRPEDRNLFSYVMEMHQRNSGANGKILKYLSQTYLYPTDFELLLYASQLLQADAIRYGVEHFRRNRGDDRCMGAVYWQLNDIWPVASWASVDYYGRWKALHYSAKRFFAPVLLSCEETSLQSLGLTCISEPRKVEFSAHLSVSNETWDTVEDTVIWEIRDEKGEIFREGRVETKVEPFAVTDLPDIDLDGLDPVRHHLHYRMERTDSAGTALFLPPKHYAFADPGLKLEPDAEKGTVTVSASAYAKAVEIYLSCEEEPDGTANERLLLEDNFFDMEPGTRTIRILSGCASAEQLQRLRVRSVYDIR